MADQLQPADSSMGPNGFRISTGPVVPNGDGDHGLGLELGELPRVYGEPLLFAIARDPHTLFVYWNVDWSHVFAAGEPIDRQVYLRVQRSDGSSESQLPVEPMLGAFMRRWRSRTTITMWRSDIITPAERGMRWRIPKA
jgi:hypothetical protein